MRKRDAFRYRGRGDRSDLRVAPKQVQDCSRSGDGRISPPPPIECFRHGPFARRLASDGFLTQARPFAESGDRRDALTTSNTQAVCPCEANSGRCPPSDPLAGRDSHLREPPPTFAAYWFDGTQLRGTPNAWPRVACGRCEFNRGTVHGRTSSSSDSSLRESG